jgi:hypothetical protein
MSLLEGGIVMLRRIAATVALLTTAALAACTDTDEPTGTTTTKNTTVHLFNATSDAKSLDLITAGGAVETGNGNIAFGTASGCTKVNSSDTLAVRVAGGSTNLPNFSVSLAPNRSYLIVVAGPSTAPTSTTFDVTFSSPGATMSGVTVVNATLTATSGPYDVYVNPGATLGDPVATNVDRNTASPYFFVAPGKTNTVRLTKTEETGTVLNITAPSQDAGAAQALIVIDPASGATPRSFAVPYCT